MTSLPREESRHRLAPPMLCLLADDEAAAQALLAPDHHQAGSGGEITGGVTAALAELMTDLRHVLAVAGATSPAGLDPSMVNDLLVRGGHAKGTA